ncbi:MAG: hypothetical protein HC880_02965 [Bacteroidia bacterium]|nr:hypothetical protein [Bacteroidia bacterium]
MTKTEIFFANVTTDHVKKAIELFDREPGNYNPSVTTFLIYNNKQYPAKHLLKMAYKIANQKEIDTEEYYGGKPTAKVLQKLGFFVQYRDEILGPIDPSLNV